MVEDFGDITSIRQERGSLICETRDGKAAPWKDYQYCSFEESAVQNLKPIKSVMKMKAGGILKAVDQLNERAKLWRRTGATHTSIICDSDGQILASCEDVGRSSSVDKTVGAALLAGVNLPKCALITSGRLSGVMVAKAVRAGFPVLASRSAPLNSGVELAQRMGMTLVGFARSPRLYVYAGEERIL
jgi:FdhD protein